jgi:hypothetical protein
LCGVFKVQREHPIGVGIEREGNGNGIEAGKHHFTAHAQVIVDAGGRVAAIVTLVRGIDGNEQVGRSGYDAGNAKGADIDTEVATVKADCFAYVDGAGCEVRGKA